MVRDLLPRHNSLWVSLLKMLISQTLSLYGACFFFFLLLSDHLSREKEAGNACTCAVMCSLYAVLQKKKHYLGPLMRFTTDLIYYILVCFINICATIKPKPQE